MEQRGHRAQPAVRVLIEIVNEAVVLLVIAGSMICGAALLAVGYSMGKAAANAEALRKQARLARLREEQFVHRGPLPPHFERLP